MNYIIAKNFQVSKKLNKIHFRKFLNRKSSGWFKVTRKKITKKNTYALRDSKIKASPHHLIQTSKCFRDKWILLRPPNFCFIFFVGSTNDTEIVWAFDVGFFFHHYYKKKFIVYYVFQYWYIYNNNWPLLDVNSYYFNNIIKPPHKNHQNY